MVDLLLMLLKQPCLFHYSRPRITLKTLCNEVTQKLKLTSTYMYLLLTHAYDFGTVWAHDLGTALLDEVSALTVHWRE